MEISFEGIGQVLATFTVEEGAAAGSVVTVTENGTVGLGEEGSLPCGLLLHTEEDGKGAVQLEGMACVSWTGSAPGLGWSQLACDGQGGVKTVESDGLGCMVVWVDEESQTAVIKL